MLHLEIIRFSVGKSLLAAWPDCLRVKDLECFSKTLDFALLPNELGDPCGIQGKLSRGKRAKKANFRPKKK